MNEPEPDVALIRSPDGAWRLTARNFSDVRTKLGQALLVPLARCFVHENRLLTLAHYRALLRGDTSAGPATLRRTKSAILWFEVGTIRELGLAIADLRQELHAKGWLDADRFATLSDVEVRWRRLAEKRNKAAFHVDSSVVATGLNLLPNGPLTLAEGDGLEQYQSAFPLGDVALLSGIHEGQEEANALVRTVVTDREAIVRALTALLVECIERSGLTCVQVVGNVLAQ